MSAKILIVEDDVDIRDSLRQLLEDEGFSVLTAGNGREGLERLKSMSQPCLILLDLLMPVMDGREFLDEFLRLRNENDFASAASKVLVLSAAPPQGDMAQGIL